MKHIHGGHLRQAAEKYGLAEKDIIDFSSNINPLGPSPKVGPIITQNLQAVVSYPDPECLNLRHALSEYTGVPLVNLILGNGAAELIYLLLNVTRPTNVLLPVPAFSEYGLAVYAAGGNTVLHRMDENEGFALDLASLVHYLSDVQMVFLCNPNNPTGTLVPRGDIIHFIEVCAKNNVTVIVDEAFIDFVACPELYSVLKDVTLYPNLIVLYSLTKFFAIPGLRLGALAGPEEMIDKLNESKDPWNVNCFAQLAGLVSLHDAEYINKTKGYILQEKEYLYNRLFEIPGCKPFPPAANFVFCSIKGTGFNSTVLTGEMAKRGILIRDCCSYENLDDSYIRVAVRTRAENDLLVNALTKVVGK